MASVADPLAKLDHARAHLDLLDQAAKEYVEDRGSFKYEAVADGDGLIFRIRRLTAPPTTLALICGDAVHNMRSSLDYLVRQLGIADSKKVSDKSAFPVVLDAGQDEVEWRSTAGRTLGLLSATHRAEVRKLQPFVDQTDNSPNVMLAILDGLEGIDKHNLPVVVTAAITGTEGEATGSGPTPQVFVKWLVEMPAVIGDESVDVCRLVTRGPAQRIHIKQVTRLTIRFGSPDGPTVQMLRSIADTVGGITGSFARDLGEAAG